jgi:hypothetical protein
MLISKPNKKEDVNSISECYNNHMEKFQKTKNTQDRNFKLQMSLNANKIKSEEKEKEKEKKTFVYKEKDKESKFSNENLSLNLNQIQNENQSENENFTYDKKMIHKNFEKKYSNIMSSISPKNKNSFFPEKNFNLWELKLKQKSNVDKNPSTKNLENFKLNMLCGQSSPLSNSGLGKVSELRSKSGIGKLIGDSFDEKKHFSPMNKTSNFKFSTNFDSSASASNTASASVSDFFKSSKSSFFTNINNNNTNYDNFNVNFIKNCNQRNKYNDKTIKINSNNSNYNNNYNPNMSFNSIKSASSNKNFNNINLSPRSNITYNNNKNYNNISNKININRVNFDAFNSIGENPFKINIYDNNNIAVNTISKNYSKYGKMKDGYNLSPRNICSPKKDSLNYHTNKQVYKIEDIYESSPRNNKKNSNEKINLNSPKNSNVKKFGISNSNEYTNSRQFTMKRINNLLKNFNEEKTSFSSSLKESIDFLNKQNNISKNSDGTFLKTNNKQRLLNLLK